MITYQARTEEFRYVFYDVLNGNSIADLPGFEDATPELFDQLVEAGAKYAQDFMDPVRLSGSEQGCTFENGIVRTPDGFKEAHAAFAEGGWGGLAFPPEFGGMGLPYSLGTVIMEMNASANLALSGYASLTGGAIEVILEHGTPEQKATYLEKMISSEWTGTMCLTEAHCGTDLGLLRTAAKPNDDGTYAITGQKIFITGGEHDLTDNIVHLVLARLPDAPAGVKGISLFLVPKFLPDENGNPGMRNAATCGAIEHKMGITGSATCVMNFDGATGTLIGTPHRGLQAMFIMMNAARVGVGLSGTAQAELAYQGARAYANDRLQMRSLSGAKAPDQPADPIIVHADVRRMLLTIKSFAEGTRALCYWVAQEIDSYRSHPDAGTRAKSLAFVNLMTPIVKAFSTDLGLEAAIFGQQILGGHGYIRENGMEQIVRDARIGQIYEGTNGVQALDLLGRKLPADGGAAVHALLGEITAHTAAHPGNPDVTPLARPLEQLGKALATIPGRAAKNPDEVGAAAVDLLHLFGHVILGYLFSRMALISAERPETPFHAAKLATARFYLARILPRTEAHAAMIMAGAEPIMTPKVELI